MWPIMPYACRRWRSSITIARRTADGSNVADPIDDALTPEEHGLIEAAQALRAELIGRSQEIDQLRQLPQELAERLAGLGFYRLVVPPALGGLGVSPATLCRVCEALAGGNGSAAWCVFIGATSQYLFGAAAPSLLEKMLANPHVVTSGVFADSGTARAEARGGQPGYLINGHWRWGSGCHNAAWISGGVHQIDHAGEPVAGDTLTRVFFQPTEIEILDTWHVSGLRGTGSSDFVARDVWVPAERVCAGIDGSPYAQLPIYRFPRFALLGIPIGAICLGMARASLEEVLGVAQQKTPQGSRRTLAMRPALHKDLAVADAELGAARAHFYQCVGAAWAHARHAMETLEHRRAVRTANVHAVTTSMRVIDRMYTVMGGTSVFESSCLQQHFRDVHVASQHMMVAEPVMELAGRVMLGLDDSAPGL
jgi:alkylation response protein AidB-like acyl-CoA dehydrogenase